MSKNFVKIGAVLIVVVLVLLGQSAKKSKTEFVAKAASLRAIPKYCLGGWENPINATGQPDVAEGEVNGFTVQNSAVLSQKSAQLFCGIFETDDRSFTPTKAVLHFSWRIDFAPHEDADAIMWQQTIASSTIFESPTATTTILKPVTSTTPLNTTETVPVVIKEPPAPIPSPIPLPSVPDATTTIPSVVESPASTSSPIATTSAALPWINNLFALFTPRAYAENEPYSAQPDILEVTYTTDGKNWISVGKINEANWKDATIEIPITSWDEMDGLQIALTPIFSTETPTIYLDGMWLDVQHDISLLGVVNKGISAVADATQSVVDTVQNIFESAVNAVVETVNLEPKPEEAKKEVVVETVQPAAPQESKRAQLHFDIEKDIPVSMKTMPWARTNEQKDGKENGIKRVPTIIPDPNNNAFHITGTCLKEYFVVLMFANQTDYINDPSRAVINRAYPCLGNAISYTLKSEDFPQNMTDGTYYLLVAEQGVRESWKPLGAMYPIVISRASSTNP